MRHLRGNGLRYPDPEDGILIVLSRIFPLYEGKPLSLLQIALRQAQQVETEIVRVVSLSTSEITEIKRFIKTDLQGPDTLIIDI